MSGKFDVLFLCVGGKGDPLECKNHRGISQLWVPGKVYSRILIERVIENSEDKLGRSRVV